MFHVLPLEEEVEGMLIRASTELSTLSLRMDQNRIPCSSKNGRSLSLRTLADLDTALGRVLQTVIGKDLFQFLGETAGVGIARTSDHSRRAAEPMVWKYLRIS